MFLGPSSITLKGKSTRSGPASKGQKWGIQHITPESIALAAILVSVLLFLVLHTMLILPVCQARYMLSPDPEFSQVGAATHVSYLKAFKIYRDMIYEQADTPAFKTILSLISIRVFEKRSNSIQPGGALCGGDGESEDEMEEYRRNLLMSSEQPDEGPGPDLLTDTNHPPLPAITVSGPQSVNAITPGESEVDEPPVSEPKKRPAPRKKTAAPPAPLPDSNSALGDSTPEPPVQQVQGRPARGNKGKTSTSNEKPAATRLRKNRTK